MKFLVAILLLVAVPPVFADPLSDRTGLSTSFDVRVGDKIFEVKSTANFDIQSVGFDQGKMILGISSSLDNNIGELQIPRNVTSGQIKFYLDGTEIPAKILQNEKISFVTLEFKGNGTHTLEMSSDYASPDTQLPENNAPENGDQITTIIAVVGIMVAVGAGSTFAYYYKTKSR